eukprot:SAG31_NODE_4177_length_3502_cov_1.348810_2_plen_822_part_00
MNLPSNMDRSAVVRSGVAGDHLLQAASAAKIHPDLPPGTEDTVEGSEHARAAVAVSLKNILGVVEQHGQAAHVLPARASHGVVEAAKHAVLEEAERMIAHVQNHDKKHKLLKSELVQQAGAREQMQRVWVGIGIVQRWYRRWKHRQVLKTVLKATADRHRDISDRHDSLDDQMRNHEATITTLRAEKEAMELEMGKLRANLQEMQHSQTCTALALGKQRQNATQLLVIRRTEKQKLSALYAWQEWSALGRCLRKICLKVTWKLRARALRRCFQTWRTVIVAQIRRQLLVSLALARKRRNLCSRSWQQWLAAHNQLKLDALSALAAKQQKINAAQAARVILRRWQQHRAIRMIHRWSAYTQERKRWKHSIRAVFAHLMHLSVSKSFRTWQEMAQWRVRVTAVANRLLRRLRNATIGAAFSQWLDICNTRRRKAWVLQKMANIELQRVWRTWVLYIEESHRVATEKQRASILESAQEDITAQKDATVRAIFKHLLFRSAVKAYNTWKMWVADQQDQRRKITLVVRRITQVSLFAAFATWCDFLRDKKTVDNTMRRVVARFTQGVLAAAFERWLEYRHQMRTMKKVIAFFCNSKLLSVFHTWRVDVRKQREQRWQILLDSQRELVIRRVIKNWQLQSLRFTYRRWVELLEIRQQLESWEHSLRMYLRFRSLRRNLRVLASWHEWSNGRKELNASMDRLGLTARHRALEARALYGWQPRAKFAAYRAWRWWCRGCRRANALAQRVAGRRASAVLATWRLFSKHAKTTAEKLTLQAELDTVGAELDEIRKEQAIRDVVAGIGGADTSEIEMNPQAIESSTASSPPT